MSRFAASSGVAILLLVLPAVVGRSAEPETPPTGPFGYGLLEIDDGGPADEVFFLPNETCGTCHERQIREFKGSMHTASHTDPLYRHFAELARAEAGEKVYAYCSSCHAPIGVATENIPAVAEENLAPGIKEGVTCDTCHQITRLTGSDGPWREQGNASYVIRQGLVKYGPTGEVTENRLHSGQKREFFGKAEFCASCHTVIHPVNGFRIEETYEEWSKSVYAQHGVQCQDCHMNSVEDAVKTAETLTPVVRKGQSASNGPTRDIHPHFFVGANADADRLANGPDHARMAESRLKSAARIEIRAPERCSPGEALRFEVLVRNVAAGHNIPTGVTELRQMWIDLRIVDGRGSTWFRSGELDEHGEFAEGTVWFGAIAGDADGKPTYRPWEMRSFLWRRTVPPKGVEQETFTAAAPKDASGPFTIEARLLYRSAPPHIVAGVMKEKAYAPKITEMSATRAVVKAD